MNKSLRFLPLLALFIGSFVHAAQDNYVAKWVENTLIETLSVSYADTSSNNSLENKYSHPAWDAMSNFFNKELETIKEQKLVIHPKPLTAPTVERISSCMSTDCWKVDQSYKIPELHMDIDFSLHVVKASPANKSPFLIESLNLKIHRY